MALAITVPKLSLVWRWGCILIELLRFQACAWLTVVRGLDAKWTVRDHDGNKFMGGYGRSDHSFLQATQATPLHPTSPKALAESFNPILRLSDTSTDFG